MVDDLMQYMEKLGLRDFSGISLPDKQLGMTLLSQFPIFYRYENSKSDKHTYFDQLSNLDFAIDKSIFYEGESV